MVAVSEKEMTGKVNYGSTDTYWNFMKGVVAPAVAAMSKADDAAKLKIKNNVFELVNQKYPGKNAALDYGAVIVSGEK